MEEREIWKTVIINGVGNPRYKVSSYGRIICMNWKRTGKPRMCRLSNSHGYLSVRIDRVYKRVHRIVAETFIPNPEGKPFIDHINTIRTDNRVENLRWCTCKENSNNPLTLEHNTSRDKFGAEHHRSIAIVQLDLDGKFIKKWDAIMEVERELGISRGNIAKCCRGRYKTAYGYRWMYYSYFVKLPKRSIADINPLF